GRLDDCEVVRGDLERPGDWARSLDGCRYVVHCAARYSFAPADPANMLPVNAGGTGSRLAAAHVAGVERAVVTSSSATVGPARGTPATERDYAHDRGGASSYHHSK